MFAWQGATSCAEAESLSTRAGRWPSTWVPSRSVMSDVPTSPIVVLFREGEVVARFFGAPQFAALLTALEVLE